MEADDAWRAIAAQRSSLADLLDSLNEEQWEQPSLCADWRVRDVAAHCLIGANPWSPRDMLGQFVRARGNVDRVGHDTAVALAQRPAAELVAGLRDHADTRRLPLPVVTNYRHMVLDVLVHGQDIAVPLGIDRPMPAAAAACAATLVWEKGWPFWAKRRLRGCRLVATDADWTVGSGATVAGPIAALLLLVTGRPAGLARLSGEGADLLTARLDAGVSPSG